MLTRSGLGALVTGVVLAVVGVWWGYEELIVLAAGIGGLLLMAVWGAQRPFRAEVRRQLGSPRVARGDPISVGYRVSNGSSGRSGPATVVDECDGATVELAVPPLAPGTAVELHGTIATRRRGVFDVGPWSIRRIDPFWLAVGRRVADRTTSVIVHPRLYQLAGPLGAMHTVDVESRDRRRATDPMSGFMSLREYVPGDDPRLIHWPTTARVGSLMVREHVEVRQPEFTVVLDTADSAGTSDDLEEAVDVAASIAVHTVRSGRGVVVRTTSRRHPGRESALTDEAQVLDLLTPVQQSPAPDLLGLANLFRTGLDRSAVIVVTGPNGPSSQLHAAERVATVRIGAGAQRAPGIALAVEDAREFVLQWRPWA